MNLTRNEKIGIAVGAAAVVATVALVAKNASAATPAPGGGTTPAAQANWLVELTTPYPANAANIPLVQADLAATPGYVLNTTLFGAGGILIQPDPTNGPNGWVAIFTFNGQPPSSIPTTAAGFTPAAVGIAPVAGSTWQNSTVISFPPTYQITGLTAGTWYAFSVQTSFLSSVPNAAAAVASLLASMGFGSTGSFGSATPNVGISIAADPSASPNTFNVIAMFVGTGTNTTSSTDLPPLISILLGGNYPVTLTPLPTDLTASGTAAPGSAPPITAAGIAVPTTMPWTPA